MFRGMSDGMPATRPRTILVVDDSSTMRRMVLAALRHLPDVAFEQAVSGVDAIERVTVIAVDLVLLDLNMPDMHGLEVLRFLRAHESLRNVPVIVLTTRGDDHSRQAALAEGATLFLTKPFSPESLAPHVSRLLQASA